MIEPSCREAADPASSGRAAEIFAERSLVGHRMVDRMFSYLLVLEWLATIAVALVVSPSAWAGEFRGTHPHVWAAVVLGALTASVPVVLALNRPGRASTRQCVAIGQMLLVALLIHLSGGRPEFHFHVFVSLAYLALYRDWRVMVTASAVVALDHFLRGVYWPMSVFGLLEASPWRWVEHSMWVVFEDVVLILGMGQSLDMMRESSRRQAMVEATRDRVEVAVRERTAELELVNADLIVEVAERRKAEDEAHLSREVAELATRAKSEFLANMSHEIRTPMNAIIGMTELTLGMALTVEQRDNLGVVRDAADSLLGLIGDILDFSKIEAGKLDLEPISFRPRETVREAVRTLSLRASQKGLSMTSAIDPDIPEALVGDPHRLRQILLNLMGNAIKFTAKGRVEVRVGLDREDSDGINLRFAVIDEGIGIPSTRLGLIFEPFEQADGSTTREFGGTGLGLSISTRLVELMGGRIWVESEVGRGSSFHFTARFARPSAARREPKEEAPAVVPPDPPAPRGLRVLLVDDNEVNRRVGHQLLRRLGYLVQLAVDGPDAVARYERGGPFDVVLMDVQMPGMDGIEATGLIREVQRRQGRRCPIIALTAFAMKTDRDRCLDGGMDEHVTKPFRVDVIDRLITRLVLEARPPVALDPCWALDPDEVRSSMPISAEDMAEVVGLFRATCREGLANLREAIVDDDHDELARSARGLIDCLGLFAAEPTIALAASLEEAGRSKNLDPAGATLASLEAAIAGMQPTLDLLAEIPEGEEEKLLVVGRGSSALA